MNTKNAFSAAQNKSKRTVAAMTANAINAANAIDSLTAADGSIRNRFGKPTHQANKPPPNLPPPTAAAAKPFSDSLKKPSPKLNSPPHPKQTSSWTPPTLAAVSASWFYSTASAVKPYPLPKSKLKPTPFTPKR